MTKHENFRKQNKCKSKARQKNGTLWKEAGETERCRKKGFCDGIRLSLGEKQLLDATQRDAEEAEPDEKVQFLRKGVTERYNNSRMKDNHLSLVQGIDPPRVETSSFVHFPDIWTRHE
ncbi:hypothetical protein RUM43_010000 [Polyplax serrata]|uniref:Uncharacterized protein n=1 Tax=Polyplax serrata TaxID=468196 RepID=A0AAN8S9W7_POLSC